MCSSKCSSLCTLRSKARAFLKPPNFSLFHHPCNFSPLGDSKLGENPQHVRPSVTFLFCYSWSEGTFFPQSPVIPKLPWWPQELSNSRFDISQNIIFNEQRNQLLLHRSKSWPGTLHEQAQVLSHCPLFLDYPCHSSYQAESLRIHGWCGWNTAQVTESQIKRRKRTC